MWMVSGKWAIKAHSVNSEDFKYILGRYETEERAKEVLQAIINLSSLSPNQSNVNINDIIGYYMVKKLAYYEMPKE